MAYTIGIRTERRKLNKYFSNWNQKPEGKKQNIPSTNSISAEGEPSTFSNSEIFADHMEWEFIEMEGMPRCGTAMNEECSLWTARRINIESGLGSGSCEDNLFVRQIFR